MSKSCPSCGAVATPEARFCRQCGRPLRPAKQDDVNTAAPPLAVTDPISKQRRTTDDLAADDQQRATSNSSRIGHPTLDDFLQHPRSEHPPGSEMTPPLGEETRIDDQSRNSTSPTIADKTTPIVPQAKSVKTVLDSDDFDDEEMLTITVPRSVSATSQAIRGATTPMQKPANVSQPLPAGHDKNRNTRWMWLEAAVAGAIILCIITIAWFAVRSFRKTESPQQSSLTSSSTNAKELAKNKQAEAAALLTSGDREGAIARLREATQLDASNIEAHRRLGDLLLQKGARREAIQEYRAIIQVDPNDIAAWRALASTQFSEGLYNESVESYRRFMAISSEISGDDSVQLSYANALRQAGHLEEARSIYERISSAANADVARVAQQRLAELPPPLQANASGPQPSGEQRTTLDQSPPKTDVSRPSIASTTSPAITSSTPAVKTTPVTRALSAREHFDRGVALWSSNRTAALQEFRAAANRGHRDAYYYLGLGIAEGRDPQSLSRAQLVAALTYFQQVRQGKFSEQARRYEDLLGKEYDKRRMMR